MTDETHEAKNEHNLESKMNDKQSKGFIAKAFDFTFNTAMAAGTTALNFSTLGASGLMVAGAFAGGGLVGGLLTKKKSGKSIMDIVNNSLKVYSAVNTILYPITLLENATLPIVGSLGYNAAASMNVAGNVGAAVAKSAYAVTAFEGIFTAAFFGAYHMYDKKFNPAGIGKTISDNFWPWYKRFAIGFSPGLLLSANGISDIPIAGYNVPAFALNGFPLAVYDEFKPPIPYPRPEAEKKKQNPAQAMPTPQYSQSRMTPQLA